MDGTVLRGNGARHRLALSFATVALAIAGEASAAEEGRLDPVRDVEVRAPDAASGAIGQSAERRPADAAPVAESERLARAREALREIEAEIAAAERRLGEASADADGESARAELARLRERRESLERLAALLDPEAARPSELVEHVAVTATGSELPVRRAAVPTQVVTADEIRSRATTDVENALDAVPGLLVQKNTPLTLGASTIHLQGADPAHVAVLLDGRPFLGGIDGVVDLRDVPVGNVERVEIVRGPGSALYGSQAMAGVVNFRTRDGGADPSAEVTAAGGSFGRAHLAASHGGSAGRLRYFASAQSTSYRPEEQWGEISSQLDQDSRQDRAHAFARIELPLRRDTFAFEGSFLEEENPESHNRNPSASLSWERRIGAASRFELSAGQYHYFRRNDTPGFEEERDYDDRRAEARFEHTVTGGGRTGLHVLTAGLKARVEDLESPVLVATSLPGLVPEPIDADAAQQALYLQDEMFFGDRFSVAIGTSFDDHDRFGREASPRVAASWLATSRVKLSAAWGEGFRAPNLIQLYDRDVNVFGPTGYQVVGNPDLEPETNASWNVQVDWGAGWVSGFANGYRHDYDDLITTELVTPFPLTFSYRNVDRALARGVDAGIELDLGRALDIADRQSLGLGVGHGWLDTEGRSAIESEDGNELPFRPERRLSAVLRHAHLGWGTETSVWATRQGAQHTALDNVEEIEAHWLLNAKIVQRVVGGLTAFVEVTNLTDRSQNDDAVRVIGSRSVIGGLTYRWN
jgi:outer membrane receptor for ferrienterochelin and colicins